MARPRSIASPPWAGRGGGDTAKVVRSVQAPDQIPGIALEPALADIDHSVAGSHLRIARDEGLQSNQEDVVSMAVADLRHVVIRGYHVAGFHSPRLTEKIVKIKIGGLAAVTGINPHNARFCALDCGEQHLSVTIRAWDRGQAAQPALGAARAAVGVDRTAAAGGLPPSKDDAVDDGNAELAAVRRRRGEQVRSTRGGPSANGCSSLPSGKGQRQERAVRLGFSCSSERRPRSAPLV
jgi:hypothetical protein